ncbi:MAG: tetratricopeptide repeat protein [Candidatus Saccharicenans sp.]
MKRTERKQLKEDELATGLSRFLKWAKDNEKNFIIITAGLAVILIVVVAAKLVVNYQKGREAAYLSQVLDLKSELAQKPENLTKLEQMAQTSNSGRLASLVLATYYLEKNDLDKAEKVLDRVKNKGRDFIHYQILDLYGQVLIKKKQFEQAIEEYKQIERDKPKVYPLDVVLYHLAEAYEKKGDFGLALDTYRDLQTKFQNSYYGYQASLKAMQLSGGK